MITTTLVANGATVYIVGPRQADLDQIAKIYNDASQKMPGKGRICGLEGDVRHKVRLAFMYIKLNTGPNFLLTN